MSANGPAYRLPVTLTRAYQVLVVLGGVTLAAALFRDQKRAWTILFVISNYMVGLGLGGLLVAALHYVTGARWSMNIRRIAESMAAVLPFGALGIGAVLLSYPALFGWSAQNSALELHSPLRSLWLNRPFFLVRSLVYLVVWVIFATLAVRNSRRMADNGDSVLAMQNVRRSALFLVLFGVTCWLSSYDWVMTLEPGWDSTIFGVYNFAGLIQSGFAAVILLVVWLRRHDPWRAIISDNNLQDLGTLLFGFSCFWMYIWFCQYLLIWYVNNPEETHYYVLRRHGSWPKWMYLNLACNWAIPFLVLLFRAAKRNPVILGLVAVVALVGRWVDLSLMVLPSQGEEFSVPGLLDFGMLFGAVGVFALVVLMALGRIVVPAGKDSIMTN